MLPLELIDTSHRYPLRVATINARQASLVAIDRHYLHRAPPISFSFGLYRGPKLLGMATFGTPPSRHVQKSACRSDPSLVIEFNRLWVDDELERNTESWFVARVLRQVPPRIVVSYADTSRGHYGYLYRAMNFHYAGWTSMERNTPHLDYVPFQNGSHSRDAFRHGYSHTERRALKVRYWTVTGNRTQRRCLTALCTWPMLDWKTLPPPRIGVAATEISSA